MTLLNRRTLLMARHSPLLLLPPVKSGALAEFSKARATGSAQEVKAPLPSPEGNRSGTRLGGWPLTRTFVNPVAGHER